MNAEPNILISFLAGILSFLSPCILPLIPSYLSYIGGISAGELAAGSGKRGRVLIRTAFFIAGFTLVFVILGAAFTGTGLLFSNASRIITMVSGVIVLLLGMNIIFDFFKFLNIEKKLSMKIPGGMLGAFFMGTAFGGGWTPCIGPILAGILFLAGQSGSMIIGIAYLVAYSLGLGIPFLLTGLFFERFLTIFSRLKRSVKLFKICGGIILIGIGLLMIFGRLQTFNSSLVAFGYALQSLQEKYPLPGRLISGILLLLPGIILLVHRKTVPAGTADRSQESSQVSTGRIGGKAGAAGLVLAGILLAAGIFQFLGIISLSQIIISWLTFQGI